MNNLKKTNTARDFADKFITNKRLWYLLSITLIFNVLLYISNARLENTLVKKEKQYNYMLTNYVDMVKVYTSLKNRIDTTHHQLDSLKLNLPINEN